MRGDEGGECYTLDVFVGGKRLSLGCELYWVSTLGIAVEPLSGVDLFQAEKVMAILRALEVVEGMNVGFSVHQPSGTIPGM